MTENLNKQPTRREALRVGLIGATAGLLSLAVSSSALAAVENTGLSSILKPNAKKDAEVLNSAMKLEQMAINTYTAAAQNNLLPTKTFLDVALQFAADHGQHRDRLKSVISQKLHQTPMDISNVGTFPIPKMVLHGKEGEVIRYALTLETLAAKAYFDNLEHKLTTDEGRDVSADIMPVENQHMAVYRAVLMVLLKEKGLPGDDKLVPYSFLSDQPVPAVPTAN